jgi:hypothetical protein
MNSISTFSLGAVASSIFISAWRSLWSTAGHDYVIQTQLVETLRSQLDRCGPEALGARPCPACQTVFCDTPWLSLGLSFLLGGCASVLGLLYIRFRYYRSGDRETFSGIDAASLDSRDDIGPRWAPAGRSNSRLIRGRPRLLDA